MANARRGARCRARPSARTRISDVRPDWVECGTLRAIDRSGGACPADIRRSADAARRGRPGTLVTPMLAASPHVPRLPSRQVASPGHWSGRHRSSPEGRSLRAARAPRKRVFASRCQTVCLEADGGASQQRTYCLLARARTHSPPIARTSFRRTQQPVKRATSGTSETGGRCPAGRRRRAPRAPPRSALLRCPRRRASSPLLAPRPPGRGGIRGREGHHGTLEGLVRPGGRVKAAPRVPATYRPAW